MLKLAQPPKRILVIHVARFGDTLLTGVAIRALKQAYPEAEIDFLGHPKRYDIIRGLQELSHVGAISKKSAPFKGRYSQVFGHKPYDLAVVWGHDAAILRYAQRMAKHLVVQQIKDETTNQALKAAGHMVLKMPSDKDLPLADWLLTLVERGLGITTPNRQVAYTVLPAEKSWAQEWLTHSFGAVENPEVFPLIGLIIESFPTFKHRDWPIEHFVILCSSIVQQYPNARFVLLGSQLPKEKVAALKAVMGQRMVQAADRLSMRESGAIMSCLDLYIGIDTGPSHVAAGVGVPMVCLFHCARRGPLVLSPVKPEVVVLLEHPCDSASCSFDVSMGDLKPEPVLAATLQQLQRIKQERVP
ncbi:MAG: glycosyltransferase family 9 protein [Fluviibacter sp.]